MSIVNNTYVYEEKKDTWYENDRKRKAFS
jgi:hypothetical protein